MFLQISLSSVFHIRRSDNHLHETLSCALIKETFKNVPTEALHSHPNQRNLYIHSSVKVCLFTPPVNMSNLQNDYSLVIKGFSGGF